HNATGLSRRRALLSLAALPVVALIASCAAEEDSADPAAGGSDPGGDEAGAEPAEAEAAEGSEGRIAVTDPWVKAAEDGMTSAFGTLTNTTDSELTLVAVTTSASTDVEL